MRIVLLYICSNYFWDADELKTNVFHFKMLLHYAQVLVLIWKFTFQSSRLKMSLRPTCHTLFTQKHVFSL